MQFSRTEMLIGKNGLEKLSKSRVAVFGLGGVGGHALEALVRSGVGEVDIIDADEINITNINRQMFATHKTIGMPKVEAAKQRLLELNPNVKVNCFNVFYNQETASMFDFSKYDYIIDAIDSVSGKIELVMQADKAQAPIIASMGAGNKLHPEMFEITDIYKTSVCPLARVMRTELKKRGIKKLKVVYSKEIPIKNNTEKFPASIAFVPPAVGLILAGEVIRDLVQKK